jgi:hypothetical protein
MTTQNLGLYELNYSDVMAVWTLLTPTERKEVEIRAKQRNSNNPKTPPVGYAITYLRPETVERLVRPYLMRHDLAVNGDEVAVGVGRALHDRRTMETAVGDEYKYPIDVKGKDKNPIPSHTRIPDKDRWADITMSAHSVFLFPNPSPELGM